MGIGVVVMHCSGVCSQENSSEGNLPEPATIERFFPVTSHQGCSGFFIVPFRAGPER